MRKKEFEKQRALKAKREEEEKLRKRKLREQEAKEKERLRRLKLRKYPVEDFQAFSEARTPLQLSRTAQQQA